MTTQKYIDGIMQCIATVIFNDKNQVLMFQREGDEWEHGWEVVKGGIHEGETAEDAARREVREEAGPIEFEMVGALPGYFNAEKPEENGVTKIHSYGFVAKYLGGDVKLGEPEHVDYTWMELDEAIEKIWFMGGAELLKQGFKLFSGIE